MKSNNNPVTFQTSKTMKKFIFWLAFLYLPAVAFAQNPNQPIRLKIVSTEINRINGLLDINLRIYADADVKLNHEIRLQSTQGLQLKDYTPEKVYGKVKEYLEAGDSINEFPDNFPSVTREAAIAALEEAKALRTARR